jgi:hypothetical protein
VAVGSRDSITTSEVIEVSIDLLHTPFLFDGWESFRVVVQMCQYPPCSGKTSPCAGSWFVALGSIGM